jgi:hypothetical protein
MLALELPWFKKSLNSTIFDFPIVNLEIAKIRVVLHVA